MGWIYGITSNSPMHIIFYVIFIFNAYIVIGEFFKKIDTIRIMKKQNVEKKEIEEIRKGDKVEPSVDNLWLHLGFLVFLLISYYFLT
jgi:hypothetical protein